MSILQQLYRQKKPQFQVLWYFSPGCSSLPRTLLMLAPQTAYFIRSTLNVNTLRQFPVVRSVSLHFFI